MGTAGAQQYNFTAQAPYVVEQFQRFGYLNIDIKENGTKLIGTFYDDRTGTPKDQFTIVKKWR